MVTLCVAQQDYWSATVSAPPSDASQDYVLLGASEYGGYTSVQFERNATTGDINNDVQFMVRFHSKMHALKLNNGHQFNAAVSCIVHCKGLFTYFLCLPFDLQMNTEVFIIWAMHTTNDASSGLTTIHTSKGISAGKHNLIAEAMAAAGITPTTSTMMMPSISVASTPQPTGIID